MCCSFVVVLLFFNGPSPPNIIHMHLFELVWGPGCSRNSNRCCFSLSFVGALNSFLINVKGWPYPAPLTQKGDGEDARRHAGGFGWERVWKSHGDKPSAPSAAGGPFAGDQERAVRRRRDATSASRLKPSRSESPSRDWLIRSADCWGKWESAQWLSFMIEVREIPEKRRLYIRW